MQVSSLTGEMYEWLEGNTRAHHSVTIFTAVDEVLRVTWTAQWERMHCSLTWC
jgi:hypothetical protein